MPQPQGRAPELTLMNVLILGNGIAGSTVARRLRQSDPKLKITMVSDEAPYPISRPALMYVFMGHLTDRQIELHERHTYQGIRLIQGTVQHIDTQARRVHVDQAGSLPYDRLVIATGSVPRRLGVPGQDLQGIQGLYHLRDLDRLTQRLKATGTVKRACIIGGGLIGVELAEMLHSRKVPVTMLVREPSYWRSVLLPEESALVSTEIARHVQVLYRRNVVAFKASPETTGSIPEDRQGGHLHAVQTDHELIEAELAGITIGVQPNLSALQSSGIAIDRGVCVDGFFRTSTPDVYAIGDCAQIGQRVEQLWYTARHQASTLVAQWTEGAGPYQAEPFYNSAKFFSLEYAVVGQVNEGPSLLYQDRGRLLRLRFEDGRLTGMNTLGLRLRQALAEYLIAEQASTDRVLQSLGDLCFDPEFSRGWRRISKRLREVA